MSLELLLQRERDFWAQVMLGLLRVLAAAPWSLGTCGPVSDVSSKLTLSLPAQHNDPAPLSSLSLPSAPTVRLFVEKRFCCSPLTAACPCCLVCSWLGCVLSAHSFRVPCVHSLTPISPAQVRGQHVVTRKRPLLLNAQPWLTGP